MRQFRWPSVPSDVGSQVEGLVRQTAEVLGESLVGAYLHGSLVLGCFNPQRSDIDVLVVTRQALAPDEKARLVPVLLEHSGPKAWPRFAPYPLEISFLNLPALHPWRYPTPYDFHFTESRRELVAAGKLREGGLDHDLAAHVTVTHHAGVVLRGEPIADVFPLVPDEHYVDSLLRDLAWCRDLEWKMYAVLSASRIWATLVEGSVHSKDSGAGWAISRVPDELTPLVAKALALYRGDCDDVDFEPAAVRRFVEFVEQRVGKRGAR